MQMGLLSASTLIAVVCIVYANAELFTAVSEVEAVFETEKVIIQILTDYLRAEEQRLNDLRKFISELVEYQAKVENSRSAYAFNPVNQFLIIKHLAVDFVQRRKAVTSSENLDILEERLEALRESLPTDEDLEGAVTALVRLQDTYSLPVAKVASGSFPLMNSYSGAIPAKYVMQTDNLTAEAFTAGDCLSVARILYQRSDYANTVEWALEALERDSYERIGKKTADRRAILDYLSFSAFETGRIREARQFNDQLLSLAEFTSSANTERGDNASIHESGAASIAHQDYDADDAILERARNNKAFFETLSVDQEQRLAEERKEADRERRMTDAYRQSAEFERYKRICRGDPEAIAATRRKAGWKSKPLHCDLYNYNNAPYWVIGPIRRELLSEDPYIVLFHDVLSAAECSQIQQLATPRLHRALVHNPSTGKLETAHYRVAKNAWLKPDLNELTRRINVRIALVTGLEVSTAEELQVANYGLGGQYEPHFDFARHYETETFRDHAGNRIATLMFYLTDVPAGGATVFTDLGVRAVPKRGAALFWFNLLRNGEGDYRTRHAACPVLVGSKWVANKWFHEGGQELRRPCSLLPTE